MSSESRIGELWKQTEKLRSLEMKDEGSFSDGKTYEQTLAVVDWIFYEIQYTEAVETHIHV